MDDDLIICRCEEVSAEEIRAACRSGAASVDAVKRITRAGKGLCQGRTCRCLVEGIISKETGKALAELPFPGKRPPVRPLSLSALLGDEDL
jgi:NAD(P)H-nitrite reductase large subunit